jgi:hypothetical protein
MELRRLSRASKSLGRVTALYCRLRAAPGEMAADPVSLIGGDTDWATGPVHPSKKAHVVRSMPQIRCRRESSLNTWTRWDVFTNHDAN